MPSIFSSTSPKQAFWLGLGSSVLVMCTVGFFVLLVGVLVGFGSPKGPIIDKKPPTPAAFRSPDASDHVRGDLNKAKVAMIEYSDSECPFCKKFHPEMKQALSDYGDQVAWVYRHFPLSFHQNAKKEAEAQECAAEVGGNDAFWKYLDAIYDRTTANGTGFALDQLVPLAKEIGVDEAKFKSCLDSGKYAAKVAADQAEGAAVGVNGTPGTILLKKDGTQQLVTGAVPIEELKAEIDKLLK